jgi:hypothetical protein
MDEQAVTVPKGKDLLVISATGHSYVSLRDARGEERSRVAGGRHVTLRVSPGIYVLETDGKIKRVTLGRLDRAPASWDARKPPRLGPRRGSPRPAEGPRPRK